MGKIGHFRELEVYKKAFAAAMENGDRQIMLDGSGEWL